ncbi:MAG: glycine cleavage system protein T [Halobacteriovoraceae bacterium]|nr:glycine cleavage system protein T [Halobacteriovoraceae bacterium]|tara:strand:+ start:8287 stop:9354 length:1068 start_codon:yes stop_codon:yes gene_type:complete
MKRTSLYDSHLDLGAKMVEFGGFEMPIQYSNLKQEALAVRNSAGMFDVSHMGEFFIKGKDAAKFVDHLITNDFLNAGQLKAVYSPLCREDGTVVDDLIAYKITDEFVMLCVNAANLDKDWDWIQSKIGDFEVQLSNESDNYSLIALQGPKSFEILKEIDPELNDIPYYSLQTNNEGSTPLIYARTGYTGEDGFEIFGPHTQIMNLWAKLLAKDVTPCGLGARDVLRLEVCYPLYGQEITDELTPFDAGLKWTVKLQKPSFVGKSSLENAKSSFSNLKLVLDKGIPRIGYKVEDSNGQIIGEVTSGSMSVVLGKGVAMARVNKEKYTSDSELFIDIRGKKFKANRHKGPFVKGGHK